MMKAFVPIVKPHGRVANVSSFVGVLSRLTNPSLREEFSNVDLTLENLVLLVERYIADVREGKAQENGWGGTHYGLSKVAETAMTKVFAREMAKSGKAKERRMSKQRFFFLF